MKENVSGCFFSEHSVYSSEVSKELRHSVCEQSTALLNSTSVPVLWSSTRISAFCAWCICVCI